MKDKLAKIKVILFDWDGVFHAGHKNENRSSTFSEADSMGVNMLRFGFWLQNREMPFTAIISGENNTTAKFWAERERLDATFSSAKNKVEIVAFLAENHQVKANEIMFVYDDILDLSLAKEVAYRVMINRKANPLFIAYCRENGYYDFLTHNDGGNHGVREACELTLDAMGRFEETIEKRVAFAGEYTKYNTERLSQSTTHFVAKDGSFI
ncbi:MAG: 3-deoxy-D-manno-octulosonate 8-phosphate phosphatase (KDO 8-P phosphatase) [Salibacteraceae bacterium]|jgi:3-deoxy-D-manno-octulosonate 8-phosphate phosphatase (KDO 8-P phosphatase)